MAGPKIGREIELPLDHLHPNPRNPRRDVGDVTDLAASIKALGLLHPILVSPSPGDGLGHYTIEAGHRRWTACRYIGHKTVPCRVRAVALGEGGAPKLIIALAENLHKEDLSAMEKAYAFGSLQSDYGLNQTEIARRTGVNAGSVSRYLALLELTPASQEAVLNGKVSVDAAVHAVRSSRTKNRHKRGHKPVDIGWEPLWFARTHSLAKTAATMCEARQHKSRRKLDGVACGQCWETAIRNDQDIVREAVKPTLGVPFINPNRKAIDPYLARQGSNGLDVHE